MNQIVTTKSNFNIKEFLDRANQYDKHIIISLGLIWNNGVQCACPIHHGDNPSGFSYCAVRKIWSCWTHGCHTNHKNNLIGLVRGIKDCSFKEAIAYITQIMNEPNSIPTIVEDPDNEIYADHYFPDSTVIDKDYYVKEFIDIGFRYSTLQTFQTFKCLSQAPMYGRIVIPFRDINNRIVGFMGYRTSIIESTVKWVIYPKGFKKRYHLFGLNLLPQSLDTIYLVEGAKDVMRMYEADIPSAGLSGRFITNEQIKLLKDKNVQTINLVLDPDRVGREASINIKKRLDLIFETVNIITLTDDPGKLSIAQLKTELSRV